MLQILLVYLILNTGLLWPHGPHNDQYDKFRTHNHTHEFSNQSASFRHSAICRGPLMTHTYTLSDLHKYTYVYVYVGEQSEQWHKHIYCT